MARRERVALEDVEEGVDRRVASERRRASDGFVEHRPQAINIRAGVDLADATGGLFGRHRGGGAEDGAGGRGVAVVPAGEAEVGEVGGAVAVEEDVRRFDVAVEDAVVVEVVDGAGDLGDEVDGFVERQRSVAEECSQIVAVDEIHGAPQLPFLVTGVVDRHDARVADAGGQTRLGEEPAALLDGGAAPGCQKLHRHVTPQMEMPGPVDDSHPSPSQFGEKLVRPERARQGGGRRGVFFGRPSDCRGEAVEAAEALRPGPQSRMGREERRRAGVVACLERLEVGVERLRGEVGAGRDRCDGWRE